MGVGVDEGRDYRVFFCPAYFAFAAVDDFAFFCDDVALFYIFKVFPEKHRACKCLVFHHNPSLCPSFFCFVRRYFLLFLFGLILIDTVLTISRSYAQSPLIFLGLFVRRRIFFRPKSASICAPMP